METKVSARCCQNVSEQREASAVLSAKGQLTLGQCLPQKKWGGGTARGEPVCKFKSSGSHMKTSTIHSDPFYLNQDYLKPD